MPVNNRVLFGARTRTSQVYYVDPSVAGALQAAIDASVADNGDIIVMGPGTHSVTETVAFNKQGITLVAAEWGAAEMLAGEEFTIAADASYTDGPVATITKPCRIIGIGFAGRSLSDESLLIDCEEAGGFSGGWISLEHCRFSCWYGAIAAGVRQIGGSGNHFLGCTFDGLFGGFGTAGIIFQNDTGGFAPAYTLVEGCRFEGLGASQHAIVHAVGSVPVGVVYKSNYLDAGFEGDPGKFLDNNNVVSTGLVADNWVAPLANKAAAFENLTNSSLGFADNHYEEA
jgi:hypothetical protein